MRVGECRHGARFESSGADSHRYCAAKRAPYHLQLPPDARPLRHRRDHLWITGGWPFNTIHQLERLRLDHHGLDVGAWLSVAAGRREVSFEGIPDFLNYGYEPIIRMVFVGLLSATFALFLQLGILSLKIADKDLASFPDPDKIGLALVIGVVAGIGERALSVQLVARAQNVLSPGNR